MVHVYKITKIVKMDKYRVKSNLDLESYQELRGCIHLFIKHLLWTRIFYIVGIDQKAKQAHVLFSEAFNLKWKVRSRGS